MKDKEEIDALGHDKNEEDELAGHPGAAVDVRLSSGLEGDERWELVMRIASSTHFKKSPRMRQFLLFVTERSMTGHDEEITEYEIGWKVFERGPNYNPSDDSIVRTTARQLRTKVKQYFDTEGAHEGLILEIPKGGYLPIFTRLESETPTAPSRILELGAPPSATSSVRLWQYVAGGFAALAILATLLAYVSAHQRGKLQGGPLQGRPSIVSGVLGGQNPTRVVVGDFGLALTSILSSRHFSVEDYANRYHDVFVAPPGASEQGKKMWAIMGTGQVTSLPDLSVAAAILRVSGEEKKNIVIEHASQIHAADLRSGNFILLAAPIANPWITLFEDKLNFRYRLDDKPNGNSGVNTGIENIHPQPGEKSLYPSDPSVPDFGVTYGLVARIPNLTGNGKVLLITGLKYTGLYAAGEYATDPNAASELARLFKVKDSSQIPDFEVVIETYSISAAPRYIKVAAFRRVND